MTCPTNAMATRMLKTHVTAQYSLNEQEPLRAQLGFASHELWKHVIQNRPLLMLYQGKASRLSLAKTEAACRAFVAMYL